MKRRVPAITRVTDDKRRLITPVPADTKKGTRSKVKWRAARTASRTKESVSKVLLVEDNRQSLLLRTEIESTLPL